MFATLLAVMLSLSSAPLQHFTATKMGSYYEQVQTNYDAQTNTTYGMFVRYDVGDSSVGTNVRNVQIRPMAGQHTKADLDATAMYDASITFIK